MDETIAKGRVLVIDDSAMVRRYIRDALERGQFEVHEAFNGVEAMEKVLSAPFDLLVVDVNMPKMDGYTFLHALRAREGEIAAIPALMTSTEAGPQDMAAAYAAGANFYLVKPVSQDDLVNYANALIGRSP
jgi:two-component system, chemotaxis family, chemotaxis protein CheY